MVDKWIALTRIREEIAFGNKICRGPYRSLVAVAIVAAVVKVRINAIEIRKPLPRPEMIDAEGCNTQHGGFGHFAISTLAMKVDSEIRSVASVIVKAGNLACTDKPSHQCRFSAWKS